MKFTQASISRIKVPAGKSEQIEFDETMPGFGLRIRAGEKGEHRTFIAQYKIGAKHRRMTLGNAAKVTLEDARKEARRIFGKVAAGDDPAADKTIGRAAASNTLGVIITDYLAAKTTVMRPRSLIEATRYLDSYWSSLHGLAPSSVNRATVAAQSRVIAKTNGNSAANRARAHLSAMFCWAIGEGLCDQNPVIGTNKQEENGPRERSLTDAEIAQVWLACPDNDYGRIVQLLMLTGCRRAEIGALQWSEVDLDNLIITLPPERTKNHSVHTVPLTNQSLAILQAIPRRADREYVFGIGRGGYAGWTKSKAVLDGASMLTDWTLHDLRRTVRTGLGMLGVAPHVAEGVLNHLPAKLIRTYDRNTYATEKRAALDLWGNHIRVIVAQSEGANVKRLKRA
jgi:integrase